MTKKYAIGADIGGSHISTILVDMQTGSMITESLAEQKVNNQASAEKIFEDWGIAIRKTMEYTGDNELAGIGFAMPGPFDYETGIALLKNIAKYDNLYGINVGDELKKILGLPVSIPFRYLNDALSFGVGECWLGKASVYKNVVAITLGTGFGSAFLINGVPVVEEDSVPPMGYVYDIAYKESIADDYFSTRWFVGEYEKRTGIICQGVKQIAERVEQDVDAMRLFTDFGMSLGDFLSPLLLKFDAQCLVIGGNISGAYSLFGTALEKSLQGNGLKTDVVISELKESAAMAGSARLLDENFWRKIEPLVSKI